MSVARELDALRNSLPGCDLVIFGDLFSQITLCVSSGRKHPQEQLDAICVTASTLLDGQAAQLVARVLGVPDSSSLGQAIIMGPGEMQNFQRSPVEDCDMLACVSSLETDLEKTTLRVRNSFHHLAPDQ